jgi:hypothetical protein
MADFGHYLVKINVKMSFFDTVYEVNKDLSNTSAGGCFDIKKYLTSFPTVLGQCWQGQLGLTFIEVVQLLGLIRHKFPGRQKENCKDDIY